MTNRHNIPGFHFSFEGLKRASQELISTEMMKELGSYQEKLSSIIDEQIDREIQPDRNIRIAFMKFKAAFRNNDIEESLADKTLLRRLSYCVSFYYEGYPLIIEDEAETKALLEHLHRNWRDTYIIGLFSALIKSWECDNQESIKLLRTFLIHKINDYSGGRGLILKLKEKQKFFSQPNGALLLGDELFKNGIGPLLAPEFLGLPRRWLEYEYFSQILAIYFEKGSDDRETRYRQIFQILEVHPSKVTAKRIISQMIIDLESNPDTKLLEKVKKIAFSRIGDPAFDAFWVAPLSFSESEKLMIEKARIIFNGWITAEFISVFFEVCINDERRRAFWLNYSNVITHFRVIGSQGMFEDLRRDIRAKDFFESRFQVLPSRSAARSAIMMRMNKHILVEFSDTGFAFYAYRHDHPHCPSFNAIYTGLEELRDASMPIIPISEGILLDQEIDEGRLRHANQWERAFSDYLNKHVLN